MCPHIHAVQGHIDGQIANQTDSLLIGISTKLLPLPEKQILEHLPEADLLRVAKLDFLSRKGFPLLPGRSPMSMLHGP